MNEGGKGCKPRPFSVSQDEYSKRWDAIFQRDGLDDNTKESNNYQDILSTEDYVIDGSIDNTTRE